METSAVVPARLVFPVSGWTAAEVMGQLVDHVAAAGLVTDPATVTRALIERESRCPTALGGGVAIPHAKVAGLSNVVVALGRARPAVDFAAADGRPVDLVFLLLSPCDSPAMHLAALSRLSRVLRAPGAADQVRQAEGPEACAEALREAEAGLMVSSR